jgi:hypothetical protein
MTVAHDVAAAFESQLVAQVVDSLAMYMMDNARFMAERLHAEFPKEVQSQMMLHVFFWPSSMFDHTCVTCLTACLASIACVPSSAVPCPDASFSAEQRIPFRRLQLLVR